MPCYNNILGLSLVFVRPEAVMTQLKIQSSVATSVVLRHRQSAIVVYGAALVNVST